MVRIGVILLSMLGGALAPAAVAAPACTTTVCATATLVATKTQCVQRGTTGVYDCGYRFDGYYSGASALPGRADAVLYVDEYRNGFHEWAESEPESCSWLTPACNGVVTIGWGLVLDRCDEMDVYAELYVTGRNNVESAHAYDDAWITFNPTNAC